MEFNEITKKNTADDRIWIWPQYDQHLQPQLLKSSFITVMPLWEGEDTM